MYLHVFFQEEVLSFDEWTACKVCGTPVSDDVLKAHFSGVQMSLNCIVMKRCPISQKVEGARLTMSIVYMYLHIPLFSSRKRFFHLRYRLSMRLLFQTMF